MIHVFWNCVSLNNAICFINLTITFSHPTHYTVCIGPCMALITNCESSYVPIDGIVTCDCWWNPWNLSQLQYNAGYRIIQTLFHYSIFLIWLLPYPKMFLLIRKKHMYNKKKHKRVFTKYCKCIFKAPSKNYRYRKTVYASLAALMYYSSFLGLGCYQHVWHNGRGHISSAWVTQVCTDQICCNLLYNNIFTINRSHNIVTANRCQKHNTQTKTTKPRHKLILVNFICFKINIS